jgi:hypothetical protein
VAPTNSFSAAIQYVMSFTIAVIKSAGDALLYKIDIIARKGWKYLAPVRGFCLSEGFIIG